jgi:hypothetical protein
MNSILPIFACGIVLAGCCQRAQAQTPLPLGSSPAASGAAPASAAADSHAGDALLRHVIAGLDAQPSIAAKLRHRFDLLGRPMIGSGIYLQQGRGSERMILLDVNLQMTGQTARAQHVCDRNGLWLYEEFGATKNLSWVDVARLGRARPKSQGGSPTADIWLALGGLPKLLGGIEKSFQFGPVMESRLEDLRVWTIEGQWKPARLAQLLPEQKETIEAGKPADLTKLVANLPDRVVLHFGADDFFPYRIEYWRSQPSDAPTKAKDPGKLLVLVELYEVRLGGKIDPLQFVFEHGDMKPTDRTQEFLDKLGLQDSTPQGANQIPPQRR